MDDGRVPIDLTEEHASAPADDRTYLREDGTLVIDILAEQPCSASNEREIVVCAPGEEVPRHDPPELAQQESLKPEVELSENANAGLSAQPGRDGAVQAMVSLTIRF